MTLFWDHPKLDVGKVAVRKRRMNDISDNNDKVKYNTKGKARIQMGCKVACRCTPAANRQKQMKCFLRATIMYSSNILLVDDFQHLTFTVTPVILSDKAIILNLMHKLSNVLIFVLHLLIY